MKDFINLLSSPTIFFTLSIVGFFASLGYREAWSKRTGLIVLTTSLVFFVLSMFDPNFRLIVTKPDNVPIVIMLFLVGFFTWFSMHQAVENDRRVEQGEAPVEKQEQEKVWVWPDLVYTELICMVVLSILLMAWSIFLLAPIEQPANPTDSPNPSKAPWYFLGLQEMLVYFDPWLAGVVLPTFIIIGLMAIPYIDTNPKGNGYFTFKERKFEIAIFLFGFIVLWVLMVVSGTFLRGPNWNFFGPYEFWDVHRVEPLLNVNLSEYFYVKLLGRPLPGNPFLREVWGLIIVGIYLVLLPVFLARPWKGPAWLSWLSLNRFYVKMGPARYYLGVFLFLSMLSLPIKMYLRWAFNLKYLVAFPEIFFNI
jgi:hypothetical protein